MILQITIFNKPVTFEIYDVTLEDMMLDSNDGTLFGAKSIDELNQIVLSNEQKKFFIENYEVEMINGGRLDILARTPNGIIQQMKQTSISTNKGQYSLFNAIRDYLSTMAQDDYIDIVKFTSIGEAMNFYFNLTIY